MALGAPAEVDAEKVQQRRVRLGLGCRRSVLGSRGTQVPEAGGSDNPQSFAKITGDQQPLIVTAAGAMDQEQRLSVAPFGIFDRSKGGFGDYSAGLDCGDDLPHLAAIAGMGGDACGHAECGCHSERAGQAHLRSPSSGHRADSDW